MAKKRRTKKSTRKKKKSGFIKYFWWIVGVLVLIGTFFAKDISIGYYDTANGLSGAALKTAMHDIIRQHKVLNFDQNVSAKYWWDTYFKKTDWHADGYFWDMYSSEKRDQYLGGSEQSREHCMPRSWWGKRANYSSYDANGDLFNLFPADCAANSAKSNLPLGEAGVTKFDNGVSKVGMNTYPKGYRGYIFEPADEYKGDFARVYFYMVTCYEDYAYDWRPDGIKSMLKAESYPGFQPWALEMLLKWSREDPVSEKEIERNKAVYRIQGNRNPFVDFPDLAEYIWGNKQAESLVVSPDDQKDIVRQPEVEDLIFLYWDKASVFMSNLIKNISR